MLVRSTCILHCTCVHSTMLLFHSPDGDCAAETVHTGHTAAGQQENISVLVLPGEYKGKVSFISFTGQAGPGSSCDVCWEVERSDFRWNLKRNVKIINVFHSHIKINQEIKCNKISKTKLSPNL